MSTDLTGEDDFMGRNVILEAKRDLWAKPHIPVFLPNDTRME